MTTHDVYCYDTKINVKIVYLIFYKDDDYEYLKIAHIEDSTDCVKRLICEFGQLERSGYDMNNLPWDVAIIKLAIQEVIPNEIDYSKPWAQFNLAAHIGRKQNIQQCPIVYGRFVVF